MSDLYLFNIEVPYRNSAFDGINNYLFNKKKLKLRQQVIAEGEKFDETRPDPIVIIDPLRNGDGAGDNFASKNDKSLAYFMFHYKNFALSVENYTIRTRTDSPAVNFPLSWKVEASNDGNSWNRIHSKNNTKDLSSLGALRTYESENLHYYSFFRFTMTDLNIGGGGWTNNWIFHISKVEFFGSFALTKDPFAILTCFQKGLCNNLLFLITIIHS